MNDEVKITPETGHYKLTGYAPSVVIDGPDQTYVSDPIGGSDGAKLPNGRFTMNVRGSPLTGEANEPTLMRVLAKAMELVDGVVPQVNITPPNNATGEDAIFSWPGGKERVVQAVTVPPDASYQHKVSKGVATVEFSAAEGAGWLRDAIHKKEHKYPPDDRRKMILALDARHAGILAHTEILSTLSLRFPEIPVSGFDAIWIVGAIAKRCVRIA